MSDEAYHCLTIPGRSINRDFLQSDDFIIEDLSFEGARHVLFATPDQLQHLQRARRWFIDGTFKVVSRPFYQLMSIHAFVKKDDDIKQVPLLFVLMSRRQKRDYVAVFEALLKKFEPEQPNVEWFMLDFEAAAWQAVRQVFQRTLIRGCMFHWTQCIYRMVVPLGLSTTYTEGGSTYAFIRKVLALPFLPAEHVRGAFDSLNELADQGGNEQVLHLIQYVRDTWVEGNIWQPEYWSVFRETVRTNNDVEGWHRGLNSRANGSSLQFYVLVPLLRAEAQDVSITVRQVSENLVTRNQRKKYAKIHGRLFDLWDQYEEEEEYTTSKLPRDCSNLIGYGPIPRVDDHGEEE